ncbi:hypothetical protein RB653_009086 [Dictyostelium firmibasis]|uniref:BRO1 domain-containing protein n=1 Tax=Dictyostelium firmibasis TaxID=79012 RepID=A0AAN7U1P2_9MYCE
MNQTEKPLKFIFNSFELPQSKRVQFEKIIRTQTPQSSTHLSQTSLSRNELIIIIEKSSFQSVITACEKYIPDLYGLMISVEDNNSLRLNEQLSFSWSSITGSKSNFYSGFSLRFELIMSLVVYGLAHYNRASEINDCSNESNFDENAKLMVNHLKTAAGIFNFITSVELPRWMNIPEDRPVECRQGFSLGMYEICLSTALSITARKAVKQSTSPSIISKLHCEAWQKAEMAKQFLKDLENSFYKKLSKSFKQIVSDIIIIENAKTFMFMALNAKSQGKIADALGYFSQVNFSKIKKPSNTKISTIINSIVNDVILEQQGLTRENDVIYFEKRTDINSLPEKPSPMPKSIVNMITFSPPLPSFMSIN